MEGAARGKAYGGIARPATVIASEAKQSIPPHEERMDCFVASLLAMTERAEAYRTTAAVCPNSSLRSSSVRIAGWPKFGLTSFALA